MMAIATEVERFNKQAEIRATIYYMEKPEKVASQQQYR